MDLEEAGTRWMRHMRAGEWEEAWRLSDAGVSARGGVVDWQAPRHLQHIWDGSPLAGRRVLVRCYHGLGDTLQFIRVVPLLAAIAADVTVWAQPALLPLLSTMRPAPRLLPLHDGTPEADYDVDVEVMELLHAFRCTPATLPADVPYLHPPPRPRAGDLRLAVGLVWRAGDWDPGRSIPVPLLLPLAHIPGVALHILQRGPGLGEWPPGLGTVSGSDDPLEAASVMRSLDLVLSVDSMPAHLAGALGVPVWTLVQHRADWRWMEGGETSPWYPSMRLLRQPAQGDWAAVMDTVARRLRALAAG